MYLTRREFFRCGLGGAVTMALASVAPLVPTEAYAIAGVDDAVVGALLIAMMALSGYTVATTLTSTSLANMGYSFSEFAADANNQQAAVARALADANNLGVQVNRQNAEDAAAAIAAGTGAFADWIGDVAATGRATIDGWLGGAGANQAALWGLVSQWRDAVVQTFETATADSTMAGKAGQRVYDYFGTVRVAELGELSQLIDYTFPDGTVWAMTLSGYVGAQDERYVFYGTDSRYYPFYTYRYSGQVTPIVLKCQGGAYFVRRTSTWKEPVALGSGFTMYNNPSDAMYKGYPIVTPGVLSGGVLPGVDKAADCPETLGAGYDITPVGADAVVGSDGSITDSGTIAVPIGVALPGVDVPYAQGLYGLDAGVVSGIQELPYSADLTDAWVGTPEGVVSMPISQAIASSTSIGATAEPSVPVVPPNTPDVGPWTPAYDLPFYEVWPFNMIYTFVEQLSVLGGAQL